MTPALIEARRLRFANIGAGVMVGSLLLIAAIAFGVVS